MIQELHMAFKKVWILVICPPYGKLFGQLETVVHDPHFPNLPRIDKIFVLVLFVKNSGNACNFKSIIQNQCNLLFVSSDVTKGIKSSHAKSQNNSVISFFLSILHKFCASVAARSNQYSRFIQGQGNSFSMDSISEKGTELKPKEPLAETKKERRLRLRSIALADSCLCILLIGFSIISPGLYLYMKQVWETHYNLRSKCNFIFSQLLPTLVEENKEDEGPLIDMYGWVVAMNALGRMFLSPVLWYLNKRVKSARPALLISCSLIIAGHALYSILSLFPEETRYELLMLSQFIVGCSSGKKMCLTYNWLSKNILSIF